MRRLLALTVALSWLAAPGVRAADAIDVMTQNQYLGADLNPIIAAPDPIAFNQAMLDALAQIAANDFATRAELLADEIADRLPELVGLQEVYSFACADLAPPTPGQGCDDPAITGAFNDHLSLTLAALTAAGEPYAVGASVQNLVIQLPVDTDLNLVPDILVTVVDHDVILARPDIALTLVPVPYSAFCARPSADGGPGCNYQVVAQANTALGPIAQERGWVGVDVTVGDKDYRFVNTHLEVQRPDGTDLSSIIQAAQAQELIGVLGMSTLPGSSLVVVGDINSSPDDPIIIVPAPVPPGFPPAIVPPYTQFVGSGYTDAWTLRPGDLPGFSCCQLDDLSNHQDINDERIDTIFSIEVPDKVKKARVLGAKVSDKSGPFDLWPSDHGAVTATLQFE